MPNTEAFGFLYPVTEDKKRENGPSMSGTAMLNGQEVQIGAWTKQSKNGIRYLSLKFEGHEISVPTTNSDDLPF